MILKNDSFISRQLTKRLKKKLDGNYTRMLKAILNKSWQQHPTRHQLYGHSPPITKTIQVRRTRHAGQCWRSKDELISDVLLWTPGYGQAKAGRPARTYIQQLYEDTGCNPEDLPEAIDNSGERGSGISVLLLMMMMKLQLCVNSEKYLKFNFSKFNLILFYLFFFLFFTIYFGII